MIIHSVKLMETHFVSGTVLSEDFKIIVCLVMIVRKIMS